ncbi:MAG: trehalose-6-phosphate synthase [Alphaproteobacteria bacterium]|nr:trehalose-6-phosphate synthase [Alphaproteobacteria bacterium]
MTKSDSFGGRTLIYSNRPPTAGSSGGAQEVIEASNPTWWVGPEAVDDRLWHVMEEHEREAHTLHGDPDANEKPSYDVITFPTPKTLEQAQYKTISNEILWPVAHSIAPNSSKTIEEIENAYFNGYLPHNDLANIAIHHMIDEHQLTSDDRVWVHDYQCSNVPGMIYSNHIPWPSVDFLETVSFPHKEPEEENVNLLDSTFYRDYIELASSRALATFQRPVDQANFIMTAAYVAGGDKHFSIESDHPDLQNLPHDVRDPQKRPALQEALLSEISIGTATPLMLFGDKMTVMNVPVGQATELTHEEAKHNESALNKTRFKHEGDEFAIFNASLCEGKTVNLTASNPADFSTQNQPTLSDLVEPVRGRDWVLSVHRNDYTKGTLTKLEAAEKVLETNDNATFLFILQPTREDVAGYKEYAEDVFNKAADIRERFGDKSVVIIPEAVKHNDILGLMRQPEMRGFMGLGHKDGHDLTVREVVDANDAGSAIGVIASSGIGASDVLGDENKGAFVINDPKNADEVAVALNQILDSENAAELTKRFDFMKQRSTQFDAANFSRSIDTAYPDAMEHRFGEEWKQNFEQPNGEYVDHQAMAHAVETTVPQYIRNILKGEQAASELSR